MYDQRKMSVILQFYNLNIFIPHLVTDTTPPVIACPANQIITTSATSTTVTFTGSNAATGTDNSGGLVTFTYSPTSGSTFSVGTTLVTATGSDPSNNEATCTFDVIVIQGIYK